MGAKKLQERSRRLELWWDHPLLADLLTLIFSGVELRRLPLAGRDAEGVLDDLLACWQSLPAKPLVWTVLSPVGETVTSMMRGITGSPGVGCVAPGERRGSGAWSRR